jgi:ribonuclease P protein component
MNNYYLREYRLRTSKDYKDVKKMGCKLYTPHFVLFIHNNGCEHPRLGVTVSRRVGNAVTRNRIKRYIKEFFRTNKNDLYNYDYSIIARNHANTLLYDDINKELSILIGNMVNI